VAMQVRFESSPTGERRAITVGLQEVGQTEFVLLQSGGVSDDAAQRLLQYIGDYITASGKIIQTSETMRYGWSTLRFGLGADNLLHIEELTDPFVHNANSYRPGAATALAILREQDAAVHRNNIPTVAHHPHRSEMVVICRHISPQSRIMVFDRIKATRPDDSGWFVGCGDASHNHNDIKELARMHLVHIAEMNHKIVMYLAMPEDTRVVFEQNVAIVFAPGQDEGHPDTGQPATS